MTKSFTYALAGAMVFTASLFSHATETTAQNTDATAQRQRIERPRRQQKAPQKVPEKKLLAGNKQLYGVLCNEEDGPHRNVYGLVEINETAGEHTFLMNFDNSQAPHAGVYMDGKILQSYSNEKDLVTYFILDTEKCEAVAGPWNYTSSSGVLKDYMPYAMAYDHTSSMVYSCFYENAYLFWVTEEKMNNGIVPSARFGMFDIYNPLDPVTIINENLPERMRAMCFDKDGQLYGLAFTGQMYKINKFTGESTPTVKIDLYSSEGSTLVPATSYSRESMACDWDTGLFYLAYGDDLNDGYIISIDPETGETEMLAEYSYMNNEEQYGDLFTAIFFKQSLPEVIKPATVENLVVKADGTALRAKVSFTMPALDNKGNAITDNMSWHISDGVNELGSGTAKAGATVNTTVPVATAGRNQIVVYSTLNGTNSNSTIANAYFGPDTPEIWGMPTTRLSGNSIVIRWNEANSINGGNLDPVTYNVTRMPDNKVVATGLTTTTYTDKLESDYKTRYSYLIEPKAGAMYGEKVESRSIYAGKYFSLPHIDSFEDEALFLEYPIIDANSDNNVWEYSTRDGGTATMATGVAKPDDYLLIGPFNMESGSTYTFEATADGHNFTEQIALYIGTDPNDVKSFSTQLLPPTDLRPSKGEVLLNASFEPTTSGNYYFALHACTTGAGQYIYVYDVTVRSVGGDAPSVPTDVVITPGASDALIEFTLPTKNMNGANLSSLTEVQVLRNGVQIAAITDKVTPGARISYRDTEELSKGYYNYSVRAVNSYGEGKSVNEQVWRGADYPGRVDNVVIWEDLNKPGLMHIKFDHPKRGFYGGYVDNAETVYSVNYLVMGASSGDIELGKGTEHTFQIPGAIYQQDIIGVSVYGRNSEGSIKNSTNWRTQVAYFGPALSLPVRESWPNQSMKSGIWAGQPIGNDDISSDYFWDIRDGSLTQATPQDGDAGMNALCTQIDNGGKRLLAPRVTLKDTKNPTLVFYYRYTDRLNNFDVEVIVDDQPIRVFKAMDLAAANRNKWIRAELPLSEFKNSQYIQLAFSGRGKIGEEILCIDNVSISDLLDNDLEVVNFTAPVKAEANETVALTATVRNIGAKAVKGSDYTVEFYKNNELLGELEGKGLAADASTIFTLDETPSVADPSNCEYYVAVLFSADQLKDNNESAHSNMRIVVNEYPVVSDLKAVNNVGIDLSWTDPDMSSLPGVSVTETFENYESFIIDNIGSWTVRDGDGCETVKPATSLGVLEFPHIGEPMAWQVFDPGEAGIPLAAWYARSGSKILVSFQACANGTRDQFSDDWLISPELNGAEQTISFYARAGQGGSLAPEIFDFMVSSKTNNPDDFSPLDVDVEVPYRTDDWTEYTYRVPAGTRYFAIVHKSYFMFAMLIDDITYIPAGSSAVQLELQGFNVYRDGKRVNDEPIADNEYTDMGLENGRDYTYHVTAVWDKGESRLSNAVTIKANSSIDGVEDHELTITGLTGAIRIEGGQGEDISIYNTAGLLVATAKADRTVEITVPAAGVYLVKAGNAVAKIAVR